MSSSLISKVAGLALALACMAAPGPGQAQSAGRVTWSFFSRKLSPTVTELHMIATMGAGWHIYAQDAGAGPVATRFSFDKNPQAPLNGLPKEVGRLLVANEPALAFGRTRSYMNTVDFVQKVTRAPGAGPTTVRGRVEYMVANDHQALPPDDTDFAINLN